MRKERKSARPVVVALLVVIGLLAGCGRENSNPLAPAGGEVYLSTIDVLQRAASHPGLAGADPIEVSFMVTPKDGGYGEAGFVSFEVEPASVKQEFLVTIRIEDPGFYLVELTSPDGSRIRKATLTIHIEGEDLAGLDGANLVVYGETNRGWRQLPMRYDQKAGDLIVNVNKLSRYALSRE
jgi:hypothetical protein